MKKRPPIRGRGKDIYFADAGAPSDQRTSKPVPGAAPPGLVKATFYLKRTAAEALEDVWVTLRRRGDRKKGRVSKSDIVTAAIERVLDEVKSLPPDKQLEHLTRR